MIIAASFAKGTTILSNCAIEPEIRDLVNFLNEMGCNIKWISKRTIQIVGVSEIKETSYSVMFDRIEAGTYLIAAAVTEGNLKISNIIPEIIKREINILKKLGSKIIIKKNELQIIGNKKIKSIKIKTAPYPGFPTDLQAQLIASLLKVGQKSKITENIFENRFIHIPELRRFGAQLEIEGNTVVINKTNDLFGAEVMATDIRASFSLIIAAIISKGTTTINRIYHLDRGYEDFDLKLKKCG